MRGLVVLSLVGLVGGGAARAAKPGEAEFKIGSQEYAVANYRAALDAFTRAYQESDQADLLFNIAQCHRHLGEKQQAVEVFKHFLDLVPQPADRGEIERTIATLESEIAEEREAKRPKILAAAPAPAPPPPTPKTPIYRRWWLWTTVAAVVLIAAGVGIGVWAGTSPAAPTGPVIPVGVQQVGIHFQ